MTRLGLMDVEFNVKSKGTNDNDIANVEEHPKTTLGDLQGDQSKEKVSISYSKPKGVRSQWNYL
jgi:hypothetical protein